MKLRKLLNTTLFNANIGMSTDIVNQYGCINLPTYIECDVLRCMLTQVILLFTKNILIGLWLHVTPSSCRTLFCTIDLTKYNKLLKISFHFKVTTVTYYAHSQRIKYHAGNIFYALVGICTDFVIRLFKGNSTMYNIIWRNSTNNNQFYLTNSTKLYFKIYFREEDGVQDLGKCYSVCYKLDLVYLIQVLILKKMRLIFKIGFVQVCKKLITKCIILKK